MNYLVTGGCGFIGSHFVELLLANLEPNDKIVIVDKMTYAANNEIAEIFENNEKIELIKSDIYDTENYSERIQSTDVVINFAAESHVDNSIIDPMVFTHTNVVGMQKLLHNAHKFGVKTFIQISTDEVYGSTISGAFEETSPISPNSPYAASKAAADMICRAYFKTYDFDVRITRSCNNYGVRQNREKFIPVIITNLSRDFKVPIYGSGRNIREWILVTDHCKSILKVLRDGTPGEVYNIGTGELFTNIDLAKLICKAMNKDINLLEQVKDRAGHDFRYSINSKYFVKQFGEIMSTSLKLNLDTLINYYTVIDE
jgi:dTDP-glucose 4,6-dehydratase